MSNTAPSSNDVSSAMKTLRNRSTEESLGVNTEKGLLKASVQAGIATALVFSALTVGPYIWTQIYPPPAKPTKETPADTPAVETPKANPTPGSTTPESANKKSADVPVTAGKNPPPKKDLLDALGETGTKKGTPSDPFNKKDDDLLKDLK